MASCAFLYHRKLCPMTQKRSARYALVRRRNMSQATALRVNEVLLGSGMSGGVEQVDIHDCTIRNTERGIRIKSMPGRGGYVRNVTCRNMTIEQVEEEGVQVSMNYGSSTAVPVSSKAPVFSDIAFRNIEIKGAKVGVEVCGLPESPVKVRLDKVEMQVEREIQVKDGEVLDF